MNLGLDFTKRLQDADHWEMLESIQVQLIRVSSEVGVIRKSLDLKEVGEFRQDLAGTLATIEVFKEIVRMKLSVMDGEWEEVTSEALENIEKELFPEEKVKEDFDSMEF